MWSRPRPAAGLALRHPAADDDPHPGLPGARDPVLVLPLQGGVGDLHHVEHAPVQVGGQVRQRAGDADEAHPAAPFHLQQGVHQAAGFTLRHGGVVELHHVDAVAAQSGEASIQPAKHIVAGPHVVGVVLGGAVFGAAALGGEAELAVTVGEEGADAALGLDVVVGAVEEVDADIQHFVQELVRRLVGPMRLGRVVQCGAEAEPGHLDAGVAQVLPWGELPWPPS